MPPQVTTAANLLSRLDPTSVVKANAAAATAATTFGNAQLPPIKGGIAQLNKMYFDEHKDGDHKGKIFFYASGIIQHPEAVLFKGALVKIKGRITNITEVLYDTPDKSRKTQFEHQAFIYNLWRQFKIDTAKWLNLPREQLFALWLATCEALVKAKPFFNFEVSQLPQSTDPRYKDREPGTYQQWLGVTEFSPTVTPGGGFNVKSGQVAPPASVTTNNHVAVPPPSTPEPAVQVQDVPYNEDEAGNSVEGGEYSDQMDLDELGRRADSMDDGAISSLIELALKAGISQADLDGTTFASWTEVVEAIKKGGGEAPATALEESQEEWKPKVEDIYAFKPMVGVGKNRKKADAAVEVQVTAVDEANKKVDLLNTADTKKTYKGISWGDLETPE